MSLYIDICCDDQRVSKNICANLMAAMERCATKSHLFVAKGTCHGISVVINPENSLYNNCEQITDRIFLKLEGENFEIDGNALNLFKCYCIGLDNDFFTGIDKILIILMSDTIGTTSLPSQSNGDNNDDKEQRSYTSQKPLYTLDRVILTAETRVQIDRAISLIEQHDKIFNEWGFAEIDPHTKTILCFHGAPGTGKTMCAHAIASALGKNILIASYASIESKWVGEGPKNLQQIFKDAAEQQAILFFDEADSFLSKRVTNAETGSDKHYNRMSNEMFQLLEDYNGEVIFATNMVTDFDKAFKSRILAFVEFVEPDHDTRKQLINIMIPKKLPLQHQLQDEDLDKLATISSGFSGREIRKSILTTLAEGAANNVACFSMKEFEVGFNSVKLDSQSINNEANEKIDTGIISDFMQENTTNSHIIDICLYTAWQETDINGKQQVFLVRLCKALGCERPDFSISYKNKCIIEATNDICNSKREQECIKYCCELLGLSTITPQLKEKTLQFICNSLKCCDNIDAYKDLVIAYSALS